MAKSVFIVASILGILCLQPYGCKSRDESNGDLKIYPKNLKIEGNCADGAISAGACKVSATPEGFETNVVIRWKGGISELRAMSLEMLDKDGKPLNGWPEFHASHEDLKRLRRGGEQFITFSVIDKGKFMRALVELVEEDHGVDIEKLEDTRELAKRLKKSGAKKFVIHAECN